MFARFLACAAAAALALPAAAQEAPEDEWSVWLGAAVLMSPQYRGSDEFRVLPLPAVDIRYGDDFYLNPVRGAGLQLFGSPRFDVYGGLSYVSGRDSDGDLPGLEEVDGGAAAFGEVVIRPFESRALSTFQLRARVDQPVTGDVDGPVGLVSAEVGFRPAGELLALISLDAEFGSASANDNLFGITPAQSDASGFDVYDPDDGLFSVGATAFGLYPVGERWRLFGLAGYDRLSGEAADSPVVADRNQFSALVGVLYRFN